MIEMTVKNRKVIHGKQLAWLYLEKLNFSISDNHTLRRYYCPELTHLSIEKYTENDVNFPFDCANSFANLTSLKFQCYDENVERFMGSLNRTICGQLKEFSLSCFTNYFDTNQRRRWINLTCNIIRFSNLETLHLYVKGIEHSNVQVLFENCSKLVKLSVFCSCWSPFILNNSNHSIKMFRKIKKNCKQIEVIQVLAELLKMIYTLFPKTKINLIEDARKAYLQPRLTTECYH